NGQWLADGAFANNSPITEARQLGATRVWISRLPTAAPDPNGLDDPLALSEALLNSLFKDDTATLRSGDIDLVNPTYNFGNLDFSPGAEDSLVKLGRAVARAAFAAAPCVRPRAGRVVPAVPTRVTEVMTPPASVEAAT